MSDFLRELVVTAVVATIGSLVLGVMAFVFFTPRQMGSARGEWTRLTPTSGFWILAAFCICLSAAMGIALADGAAMHFGWNSVLPGGNDPPPAESYYWGIPLVVFLGWAGSTIALTDFRYSTEEIRYRGLFRRLVIPWNSMTAIWHTGSSDRLKYGESRTLRLELMSYMHGYVQFLEYAKSRGVPVDKQCFEER